MDKEESIQLLESVREEVEELEYGVDRSEIRGIRRRLIMIIKKVFEDESYINQLKTISLDPSFAAMGSSKSVYIKRFQEGKADIMNLINVMLEDIQLSKISDQSNEKGGENNQEPNENIFIVHGRNNEMKQSVARVIEQLDLNPVILHEQSNKGRTIIEKFTDHSDVGFAIILLSADDFAYLKEADPEEGKYRARQNVILELGFFLGKLGRKKVLAIHESHDEFEFPSDYQGVLYTPFDGKEKWKFDIVKELKENGYEVDANQIL